MIQHKCAVGQRVIHDGKEVEVASVLDHGMGWVISIYPLFHGQPRKNSPKYIGNEWDFIAGVAQR